jgi:uncharacterized protein YuzE
MEIKYDRAVDAAYIALVPIKPGGVRNTYACDVEEVGDSIILDFDGDGRLIGIEILNATALLPHALLFGDG